jgi:hypothetical protein
MGKPRNGRANLVALRREAPAGTISLFPQTTNDLFPHALSASTNANALNPAWSPELGVNLGARQADFAGPRHAGSILLLSLETLVEHRRRDDAELEAPFGKVL